MIRLCTLVLRSSNRPLVNQIFAGKGQASDELPPQLEFPLRATTTVGELEEMYGIQMDAPRQSTLDQAIRQRLGDQAIATGAVVRYGQVALRVRALTSAGTVAQVGLVVLPEEAESNSS